MDNHSKTGLIILVKGESITAETAVYAIELGFEFGHIYVHAIVEPAVLSSKTNTDEQKTYMIQCAEETLEEGGWQKPFPNWQWVKAEWQWDNPSV